MRDRARALDVAGRELLGGADVDQHGPAAGEALAQLVAVDRLDLLAEVSARGALDVRELGGGRVAQREPQVQGFIARERVAHARALARARHQTGRVQRLQVLGGVRERLAARARELVDGAGALCEQVEQLEAAGAGKRLPGQRDRFEERGLALAGLHAWLFN